MKLKTTKQDKILCRHIAKDMTIFTSLLDDLDTLEARVKELEEELEFHVKALSRSVDRELTLKSALETKEAK